MTRDGVEAERPDTFGGVSKRQTLCGGSEIPRRFVDSESYSFESRTSTSPGCFVDIRPVTFVYSCICPRYANFLAL